MTKTVTSNWMDQHFHQFTLPVEWKYLTDEWAAPDQGGVPVVVGKTVTKLRCSCGEETKR